MAYGWNIVGQGNFSQGVVATAELWGCFTQWHVLIMGYV